jgi:hypothetical protein
MGTSSLDHAFVQGTGYQVSIVAIFTPLARLSSQLDPAASAYSEFGESSRIAA